MSSLKLKELWPLVSWFCGGVALGQFAESVLFPLWSKLGLLSPIGHWLNLYGSKTLLWCWLVLWINATSWSLAVFVGLLRGLFAEYNLVLNLMLFGIGFAFVPLVLYAYLYSQVLTFGNIWQHSISIVLAILFGLMSHRLAYREIRK